LNRGEAFIPFRVEAMTLHWSYSSKMSFFLTFIYRPSHLEVGRPRTKMRDRGNFGRRNCFKDPMMCPVLVVRSA